MPGPKRKRQCRSRRSNKRCGFEGKVDIPSHIMKERKGGHARRTMVLCEGKLPRVGG